LITQQMRLNKEDTQILADIRKMPVGNLGQIHHVTDDEYTELISRKDKAHKAKFAADTAAWEKMKQADYEHPAVKKQFGGSVTGTPHNKPPARSSDKYTHGGKQPEIDKWHTGRYNRNEHGGPLADTHKKHTNDSVSHKGDKRDADTNSDASALQNGNQGPGTGLAQGNKMLSPPTVAPPKAPKTGGMRTNAGIGGATQPLGGVPVDHVHTATAHPKSTPAHQVTPGDNFDPFHSTLGSEETFSSSNNQGISLRQIHLKSHLDNKWNQTALTAASDVNFMRVMNAREGNW